MNTKTCRLCNEKLPIDHFPLSEGRIRHDCRECLSAARVLVRRRQENRAFNCLVSWPAPGR